MAITVAVDVYSIWCVDGLFAHYLTVHTTAMNNHICSQMTRISPIISKSLAVEHY